MNKNDKALVPSNGMKIGFFDSGLGGLTILSEVRKHMPQYDYLYLGDTEHMPYGDRSESEIYALTKQAVLKLFEQGALLVIIACNTASAESARKLQDEILVGEYKNHRILGVIIPTIEVLVESNATEAFLIGTERTISSHKYDIELQKISSHTVLRSKATPTLVPKIETGNVVGAYTELKQTLDTELGKASVLILGCTHYTLLKEFIRAEYPITVISQDEIIPQKLEAYLKHHPEIEKKLAQNRGIEVVLTKENNKYQEINPDLLIA